MTPERPSSGKLNPKSDDYLRKRLLARDEKMKAHIAGVASKPLSSQQRKSPAQRRSDSLHKKLRRGSPDNKWYDCDCRGCVDEPLCKMKIQACGKYEWNIGRCNLCGKTVAYRWIEESPWTHCTICNKSGKFEFAVGIKDNPQEEREIKSDYGEDYEGEKDEDDDVE